MCSPVPIFSCSSPAERIIGGGVVIAGVGAIIVLALKALRHFEVDLMKVSRTFGFAAAAIGAASILITALFFYALLSRPIMPHN